MVIWQNCVYFVQHHIPSTSVLGPEELSVPNCWMNVSNNKWLNGWSLEVITQISTWLALFPRVCGFSYPSLHSGGVYQQDSDERRHGSWFRISDCLLKELVLRASFPRGPPWLPRSCLATCVHSRRNSLAHYAAWGHWRWKQTLQQPQRSSRRKGGIGGREGRIPITLN